jgi:hypothetical protein
MKSDLGWTFAKVMDEELSALVSACMDERGEPKAPSKQALMKARAMLSSDKPWALVKTKPDSK